jgi:hypothetical protein
MTEWWTYRPSDLLMFSPRVYARLIEAVNAEAWPLQWIGAAAAIALLVLLLRRDAWGGRVALGVLAVGWGSVALFFHARHFSTINTAAPVFAWAFGLQALLMLALAGRRAGLRWILQPGPRRAAALLLAALAAAYPLAAPLLGRPWSQAQGFGLLPDPTVLAALAVLLGLRLPAGLALPCWTVPLLWCVVAALLQWTLHQAGSGG